jgi:glycine/D-amino acid oxidase-like deaminating enzyme
MTQTTIESWHGRKVSPVYSLMPKLEEPNWKSLRIGDVREFWEQHAAWENRIDLPRQTARIGDLKQRALWNLQRDTGDATRYRAVTNSRVGMKLKQIVIVGAGEVGTTLCLMIDKLRVSAELREDVSIVLVDSNYSEQHGATNAANINHETGYEYFKPSDLGTAMLCIEGGITKRLLFPSGFHSVLVPSRFFVSLTSHESGSVPYAQFKESAEALKRYYAELYQGIQDRFSWTIDTARLNLGYAPHEFGSELSPEEYQPMAGIVGGYSSAGGSINMAMDYAFKQGALDTATLNGTLTRRMTNTNVIKMRPVDNGVIVHTDNGEFEADLVVCCAAHGTPMLASMAGGSGPRGTYYLNGMLYVDLPATSDEELAAHLSRVNFVLQADNGCMFACLLAPTAKSAGLAAIYFPSESGSQIGKCVVENSLDPVPASWNDIIATGRTQDYELRVNRILKQVYRFNPFLAGYLQPRQMTFRTVFSPSVSGNQGGSDRRVRQMLAPTPITADGRVVSMSTPKWTTAELASLSLLQYVLLQFGERALEVGEHGFGPLKLDVCSITERLNFHDVRFPRQYALDYARAMAFPERLVPATHPLFACFAARNG